MSIGNRSNEEIADMIKELSAAGVLRLEDIVDILFTEECFNYYLQKCYLSIFISEGIGKSMEETERIIEKADEQVKKSCINTINYVRDTPESKVDSDKLVIKQSYDNWYKQFVDGIAKDIKDYM